MTTNVYPRTRRALALVIGVLLCSACGDAPTQPDHCPEIRQAVTDLRQSARALDVAAGTVADGTGLRGAADAQRRAADVFAVPACGPYADRHE